MSLLEPHGLTASQQVNLELARRLSAGFALRADEFDRQDALPLESYKELRESGYAALTVPERFGGRGANLYEFVIAQSRLAVGDASVALTAAMNAHVLGSAAETKAWPEDLLEQICRAVVSGALVNALASEPELGSPSRGGAFRTLARRETDGWRVNGRKTWATGGQMVDYYVVNASLEQAKTARFVIPAASPGVRLEETWLGALSLRSSAAHDVVFTDVLVPESHFIADTAPNPSGSAWFWSAMSATYLGVGIAALEAVTAYALGRVPTGLGKPIATLEGVQQKIGRIELTLKAAQSVLFEACERWSEQLEPREPLLPLLAGAKLLCSNAAVQATDLALRAAGGGALTRALSLERHLRDARAGLAHPPSDELTLTLIARARLGL